MAIFSLNKNKRYSIREADDTTVPDGAYEAPEDELIGNGDVESSEDIETDPSYTDADASAVDGEEGTGEEGVEEVIPMEEEEPITPIQNIENQMFSDLSSAELAARDIRLRKAFFRTYEVCDIVIEKITRLDKNDEIILMANYISRKLDQLKDMISDYLNDMYDSKSYVENLIYYKQCTAILEAVATLLQEIQPKESDK